MRQTGFFFKTVVFPLAAVLAACLISTAAGAEESTRLAADDIAASHILDGKKFIGPTGEKGKKVHHEDQLSFKDGQFTSSACFQYGFEGGPYTATIQGEVVHFKAETVSPTHGKMVWKGTLRGEILEVVYSWTKERWLWTTYREYWFRGKLQK